jgi:hypothetical protein
MFPLGGHFQHDVSPGDNLTVSVFFDDSVTPPVYKLAVVDETLPSNSFNVSQTCPDNYKCWNASAEAILEAASRTNLSNFGKLLFSNSEVTARNGTQGGFQDQSGLWNTTCTIMTRADTDFSCPPSGNPLASLGTPFNSGENFTFQYDRSH